MPLSISLALSSRQLELELRTSRFRSVAGSGLKVVHDAVDAVDFTSNLGGTVLGLRVGNRTRQIYSPAHRIDIDAGQGPRRVGGKAGLHGSGDTGIIDVSADALAGHRRARGQPDDEHRATQDLGYSLSHRGTSCPFQPSKVGTEPHAAAWQTV